MEKLKKLAMSSVIAFSLVFGIQASANAMHIMEGYLPIKYCIAWGIICIPFVILGIRDIKTTLDKNRRAITILAMAGAYAFVLSALKIPSVTGSSSHPTGTGLVAILFGPFAASIVGLIVLLFQAILLAHGGLTTLGANTFSMGIAGPLVSFGIWRLFKNSKNKNIAVFLAAALGDLVTYIVTSFQLALAYPNPTTGMIGSFNQFLGIFAVTQVPLAIIEGILTVVVVMGLESLAKPELNAVGYYKEAM